MFQNDFKYALRSLRRSPVFFLLAVLSLAVGIGVSTSVFSAINGILFQTSRGLASQERLAAIFTGVSGAGERERFGQNSLPDFQDIVEQTRSLAGAAAVSLDLFHLQDDEGNRAIVGESVSGRYFDVLGVRPALGRAFRPKETRLGAAEPVILISHRLWQNRYGGGPQAVGQTVLLDDRVFTVIGVAPAGFLSRFASLRADVWVPLGIPGWSSEEVRSEDFKDRSSRAFSIIARLAKGVSLAQSQAELNLLSARLRQAHPEAWTEKPGFEMQFTAALTAGSAMPPPARLASAAMLSVVLVVVSLVLLLACFNVANMLLAKGAARGKELAMRLALGAGRGRIIRQLMVESLLVALSAGLMGVLLASLCIQWMSGIELMSVPLPFEFSIDLRVLVFALSLSVGAGLLFGIMPAWRASRVDLNSAMKEGVAENSAKAKRLGPRNALVVAQIAGSFVLIAVAALFVRSLRSADNLDLGFNPRSVAATVVNLARSQMSDAAMRQYVSRLEDELGALPEIDSVSATSGLPLSIARREAKLLPEGYEPSPEEDMQISYSAVTPGYFEVLQIPLIRGRLIGKNDTESSQKVILVNETFARRFWPQEDPLAKTVLFGEDKTPSRVVGVFKDHLVRTFGEPPTPFAVVPLAQVFRPEIVVLARGRDAARLVDLFRQHVRSPNGLPPVIPPRLATEMTDVTLLPQRMASSVLGTMGLVSIFLASTGLYGVLAYSVSQRRREMGIRLALGARRQEVVRLVVRQGLSVTLVGLLVGVLLSVAIAMALSKVLLGIGPADPWALASAVAVLSATGLGASLLPALRAASVEPWLTVRTN